MNGRLFPACCLQRTFRPRQAALYRIGCLLRACFLHPACWLHRAALCHIGCLLRAFRLLLCAVLMQNGMPAFLMAPHGKPRRCLLLLVCLPMVFAVQVGCSGQRRLVRLRFCLRYIHCCRSCSGFSGLSARLRRF
jgi:hypothetical protein